jgi:membrane-bound serine protease (ClpP class)
LFLFFFGHHVAGFAGMETFILFGVGVVLILIEIFVPGFGIFGIIGIGSIIGSMVLASYDTGTILFSVLLAVAITIFASILFFKYVGYRGPMKHVIFKDSTTSEEGYVTNKTRNEIIGKIGRTLTVLRPSGSAVIDDERLDVVTEGSYIGQGRKIKVIATAGSRIVVREVETTNIEE